MSESNVVFITRCAAVPVTPPQKKHTKLRRSIAVSSLLLGLGSSGLSLAETSVERYGAFSVPVPPPTCDGAWDKVESVGDAAVDGVEYLGEKTVSTLKGVGTLLATGDPDQLFDELATIASDLAKYSVPQLALLSLIVNELPDDEFGSFAKKGMAYQEGLRAQTSAGIVRQFNPNAIAATLTAEGGLYGDIEAIFNNLDDPLSAGYEFLKLGQKWTGSGPLTYIFTAKDPMTGLKQALRAYHRQAELYDKASDLAFPTKAGVKKAVKKQIKETILAEAKKYVGLQEPGSEQEKIASLMTTAFMTSVEMDDNDPNFDFDATYSRHPIYAAGITSLPIEWMKDSYESGSENFFGMAHPKVEDAPGCISLGDYAYAHKPGTSRLNAICGVEDGRDDWWTRPVDYKLVWGDNCSDGKHDRSVWQPVCPENYVGVGFVAYGNSTLKPLPNRIACLKNDVNLLSVKNGISAGLSWVANDVGSGAKYNLGVYNRDFLGMQLMHAIPVDVAQNDEQTKYSLRVPVPVAGVEPAGEKSHCVNFYTQTEFRGWTYQACSIDSRNYLMGDAGQMASGINSFNCGSGVAGVELISTSGNTKLVNCRDGADLGSWGGFGFEADTLSSYIDPIDGSSVVSADIVALNVAQAEKRERERLQQVALAQQVAIHAERTETCESDSNEFDGKPCYDVAIDFLYGTATITQDAAEAMKYLDLACEKVNSYCPEFADLASNACYEEGLGSACAETGYLYQYGFLGDSDTATAKAYYLDACYSVTYSDGRGCWRYANVLENENGGDQTDKMALAAYQRSCDLNHAYGCEQIAQAYETGRLTIPKDLNISIDYWNQACATEGEERLCENALRVVDLRSVEQAAALEEQVALAADGDSDDDGLSDDWEVANGLDPLNANDAFSDDDNDGLNNLEELALGSDPFDDDSDGDGVPDGEDGPAATVIDDDGNLWDSSIYRHDGVEITADQSQLYRAYYGALSRLPDQEGYEWWLNEIEEGRHNLKSMAAGFIYSDEFRAAADTTGDNEVGNEELVTHIYKGVFGREPDEGGFNYWVGELSSGNKSQAQVFIDMTQSNEYVELTYQNVSQLKFLEQ